MKIPRLIIDTILEKKAFLAHAHISPDPDSVGSILALKMGLESIGKIVNLFCEDVTKEAVNFLPEIETIEIVNMNNALTIPHDVYFSLDTAKWELSTHNRPLPKMKRPVINIDHHPDNSIKTKIKLVDSKASSACEIVYFLLKDLGVKITSEMATCLLVGTIHDTYSLQNSNVNSKTLRLVAKLIDLGGNYQQCISAITRSYSLENFITWSLFLSKTKINKDKNFIWICIDNKQYKSLDSPSSGGFADFFLGRVINTNFGAMLVEKKPGLTQGYLRSRTNVDVSLIAHMLNGGGHKAASGFRIEKPAAQAEKDFLSVINSLQEKGKI